MSQTISVLVFGPALAVAGELTTCEVNESSITISLHRKTIAFDQLKVEVGGFDHDQLQLHWRHANADFMLVATDKVGQKLLAKHLPLNQVQGQKQWRLATASQSIVWKSLWCGAAGMVLLVVIGILQYDRLLTLAANQVSIETETKMGQAVLKSYNKKGNTIQKGAAFDFVQKIGARLTKDSEYKYQWIVVKDSMVNAFALPGGIVIVNAGLLQKADNANEVAAVLAHEVQHVEQKHALKNMLNSAGVAAVVMLVLGDANAAMILIAHQVSTQFFSRQVETEADAKGRELLIASKINADGMASFFKKLNVLTESQQVPEWLSSHPDTTNRVLLSEQFVLQNPCNDCENLEWDKAAILKNLDLKNLKEQLKKPNMKQKPPTKQIRT